MKKIFVIILFAFLFLGVSVHAVGVPSLISYQGRLTDRNGNLLTGTYYFKFSIFDSQGNQLWPTLPLTPSPTLATVTEGVFNVNIGDADTLDFDFNTSSALYLQVEVSSNSGSGFETLSPRQRIASTVFSQVTGSVLFGNGFYLKQKNSSTTTLYDPTNAAIIDFDMGQ